VKFKGSRTPLITEKRVQIPLSVNLIKGKKVKIFTKGYLGEAGGGKFPCSPLRPGGGGGWGGGGGGGGLFWGGHSESWHYTGEFSRRRFTP